MLFDLTIELPAPEIHYNAITSEFWISWTSQGTRIDVKLTDRKELRTLIRRALAAAAEQDREEAHALAGTGIG